MVESGKDGASRKIYVYVAIEKGTWEKLALAGHAARQLFCILMTYLDARRPGHLQTVFPSYRTLLKEFGMRSTAVAAGWRELENLGLLLREARFRAKGTSTAYFPQGWLYYNVKEAAWELVEPALVSAHTNPGSTVHTNPGSTVHTNPGSTVHTNPGLEVVSGKNSERKACVHPRCSGEPVDFDRTTPGKTVCKTCPKSLQTFATPGASPRFGEEQGGAGGSDPSPNPRNPLGGTGKGNR